MGSEMSNKASHTGETARADTKLADKGQTDRFHTLTEGRTSRKAAGSRDPQMEAGEELQSGMLIWLQHKKMLHFQMQVNHIFFLPTQKDRSI